jgi:hypothetical protein
MSHNHSYFCLHVLGFKAVLILSGWPKYVIISKFCADSYGGIDGFPEMIYRAAINLIPPNNYFYVQFYLE